MWTLIIALLALAVGSFALYEIITFEKDSLVCDTNNLEIYDDLEKRIETLEYSVRAHNANAEMLASRVSELSQEIISLKNKVNDMAREMKNGHTTVDNLIPFVDTTRGMVEENTRRIDTIQGRGE